MATIKKNKIEYELEPEDYILYDGYNYYLLTEDNNNPLNGEKLIKPQACKLIKDKEICETFRRSDGFFVERNGRFKRICVNALEYSLSIDCGFAHDCRHFKWECDCCKHNPIKEDVYKEEDGFEEEYEDFYCSKDSKKAIKQGWE